MCFVLQKPKSSSKSQKAKSGKANMSVENIDQPLEDPSPSKKSPKVVPKLRIKLGGIGGAGAKVTKASPKAAKRSLIDKEEREKDNITPKVKRQRKSKDGEGKSKTHLSRLLYFYK